MFNPLSPSGFREVVSGRRRGPAASLLRGALRTLEMPYTWAVRWRNHRYDTGRAEVVHVGVPVVSVGNLTLGGTGKTPLVEWIARWFSERGLPVGIVSRGYGARHGRANDEARELAARLPDVPHRQNPDRVAAARQILAECGCRALVLDDAFQHRRIGRDLDLVLLDALEPLGFEHVFPRGTLREPFAGLHRADLIALARADMLSTAKRQELHERVERLAPGKSWLELAHAPRDLLSATGARSPLDTLRGRPVCAFCGLGNPAGFRHTLDVCGYRVVGFREFPDHHTYGPGDLTALAAWAEPLKPAAILCTHKDLVKIQTPSLGRIPLWAVSIGLKILAGREILEDRLAAIARR